MSYSLVVDHRESPHPSGAIGLSESDPMEGPSPYIPAQDLNIGDSELTTNAVGFEGNRLRSLHQMIQNAQNSVTVLEGNSKTFEVDLDSQPSDTVTVTITGHENTDLIVAPVLTFTPMNWNLRQPVRVTANPDPDEVDDQVALVLTASEGGANPSKVDVTIIDVERSWELSPQSLQEGSWTSFHVSLLEVLAPPSGDVTFTVTGHENTDIRPSTTLTFPVNSWRVRQRIVLTTELDNDLVDDDITLTLTASGGGYSGLKYTMDVTIIDRPPEEILIPEGDTQEIHFRLKSDGPSSEIDHIATFDRYDDTDLTVDPTQLIFRSETWQPCIFEGRRTFCTDFETAELTAMEDGDAVDDQNTMRLMVTGPPGNLFIGVSRLINVRIEDNDVSRLVIGSSNLEIDEGGSGEFTVKLSDPPSEDSGSNNVTVTVPASVGDLTADRTSLMFTASNWNIEQTVTLTAAEDDDLQNDLETLWLTAQGGGFDRQRGRVVVTIRDNDAPDLVVTPRLVEMLEGTSETIEIKLSGQPSEDVTVTVSGHAGTGLAAVPPSPMHLIFTPLDYHIPQSVTLTASEDDHDMLDEDVTLHLTAFGAEYTGEIANVMVTITDNDASGIVAPASVTMEEGSEKMFGVALTLPPAGTVTVKISGHEGTDLAAAPPSLMFTPTNYRTPQSVTLTAAEDEDLENDMVGLTLTASGGGYDGVTADITVTIMDNDERPGPLTITLYDEQALEHAEAIQLPIELSRPVDQVVTVQYASTDGTAETGLDYMTSRGIVIFDPGATRGVIEIEVIDDKLPEENESFMVTLSKPRNAIIARETGTGTILDDDGASAILRVEDALVLEEEGMVRFRVLLSHPQRQMISAAYRTRDGTAKAGEDYEASSGVVTLAPGTVEAMIAVPLLKDGLDWREETFTVHLESSKHAEIAKAVGMATIQESTTVSEEVLEAYAARFVRTSSVQVVEALGERFRSGADGAACGAADRAEMARLWYSASSWDPSLGELLAGCRMSATSYSGSFSVWGRGAFRQFNGRDDDALTLRGEVTTGMLGADYRWRGGWLAGVLLAHSQGEGSFEVVQQSGEITAGLTGVYPYVSYARADWDVWLSAGAGRGQAEVLELKGDLVSRFGAMGVRGKLVSSGTIGLNYHGDVLVTDAEIKDHEVTAEVYRVRAGVEANVKISDGLRPFVEANVRSDGGSAETGVGLEFGGGIRVDYPAWRLQADLRTQGLVMHTADGFTEWGISGSVQVGSQSEGLMMRVRPAWGRGQGMSMYGQQTILDAVPLGAHAHRTELELGYGVPWKDGTARSIMGVTQLHQGVMYRLGGELYPSEWLTFSVFGLAHGRAAALGDIGVNVRGSLRY